jgi:hypothetical protein
MLPAHSQMSRDVQIMVKWQLAGSPSMAIHHDNKEVEPNSEPENFLQIRRVNFHEKEG